MRGCQAREVGPGERGTRCAEICLAVTRTDLPSLAIDLTAVAFLYYTYVSLALFDSS